MRAPRIRLAWLMMFIALAALDLGAIRLLADSWGRNSGLLGLGMLPMANVLTFALRLGLRRRESRRFLLGFELCGVAALIAYACVILFSTRLTWLYFVPAIETIREKPGPVATTSHLLTYYACIGPWATWPQLTFALAGGFLAAPGGHRETCSMRSRASRGD
jgi:hypothetical protein